MKALSLVIVALIIFNVLAATNTTNFWSQQLNISASDMHFQCFSGQYHYMQVIRVSIGIETTAECSIICSARWDPTSTNLIQKYL